MRASTESPGPVSAQPRMSSPGPMLPTPPGANARTLVRVFAPTIASFMLDSSLRRAERQVLGARLFSLRERTHPPPRPSGRHAETRTSSAFRCTRRAFGAQHVRPRVRALLLHVGWAVHDRDADSQSRPGPRTAHPHSRSARLVVAG